MGKRGKLSKVEISYIEANFNKLSVGDMAKDLNRTQDVIKKTIVELGLENEKTAEENGHTSNVYDGTQTGEFMGRKVRNGQVTTTVMTEAASERLDEARKLKRSRKLNVNHFTEDSVFQPKGKGKYNENGKFEKDS